MAEIIVTGDLRGLLISNYSITIEPNSSCSIRPSISKFSVDTEISTVVNNLGVRNFPLYSIATCGFTDLSVMLTPRTEAILMIMQERRLILPVILELASDYAYQGDLYLLSDMKIDAMKRTAKISMAGNSFMLMEKKSLSVLDKINNKIKELF